MANYTVETRSNTAHIKRRGTVSVPNAWINAYMLHFEVQFRAMTHFKCNPKQDKYWADTNKTNSL